MRSVTVSQTLLGHLRTRPRLLIVATLMLFYLGLFVALNGLQFAPTRDEVHLWPTCLRFAQQFPPSLETLRNYRELNTPLPFVVFGAIEHAFHGGIAVGRAVNLLISLGVALIVVLADPGLRRGWSHRGLLACAGLLVFPYFLGTGVLIYTDMIATVLVITGMVLHVRCRPWLGMIMFVLAISSRQYTVAFPAALCAHAIWQTMVIRSRRDLNTPQPSHSLWIAPLLATISLGGWFMFFGGPSPREALLASDPANAHLARMFPAHSLYFLSCVGAYFVLPEAVLFRRLAFVRGGFRSPLSLTISAVVVTGFVLAPPLHNVDYNIPTMGYLDKVSRLALSDPLRMVAFSILALLAVCRFSRINLAFLVVSANTMMMLKAQVGWDKYALPLLVVLWWQKSRGTLDDPDLATRLR